MKRSDWIPLSERRPRYGQAVLAFSPPYLVASEVWINHPRQKRFTHWMKLELPSCPHSILVKQNLHLLSLLSRHD